MLHKDNNHKIEYWKVFYPLGIFILFIIAISMKLLKKGNRLNNHIDKMKEDLINASKKQKS